MLDPAPTEPPIFFIHVMKTGGTTIFRNLRSNYPLDELYPYRKLDIQVDGEKVNVRHHLSVPYLLGLPPERHRHIRVYTGHFPLAVTEMLGGRFRTATLLRDPVERTISLLRQFRRKAPWLDPEQPMLASHTIEEVYVQPIVFEPLIHNHQTKIFSMLPSDHPQSYMDVLDIDDARLALAKQNLAKIDVLGVTERFDDFLAQLSVRFGWDIEPDARANATPSEDLQPVSDDLRRQIAQDNALDMELYRYATELVALRSGGGGVGA